MAVYPHCPNRHNAAEGAGKNSCERRGLLKSFFLFLPPIGFALPVTGRYFVHRQRIVQPTV